MAGLFNKSILKKLYIPQDKSNNEENGQVTIIGGSKLFHGAPILSLKVASRIVDMAFFASPEKSVGRVAERVKSKLTSFIWVPWQETEKYVEKSNAVLIGPGLMRFRSEKIPDNQRQERCDEACQATIKITKHFLARFPNKKWVIDAGSLQVLDIDWVPQEAILTPNQKEYELLFNKLPIEKAAKKHKCIIVLKGPKTLVCSAERCVEVRGGNPGMTKGGTGDVQAGLTVGLLAKNEPFLAASSAAHITKVAADRLYKRVGTNYNADDLAEEIPTLFFPQKMR